MEGETVRAILTENAELRALVKKLQHKNKYLTSLLEIKEKKDKKEKKEKKDKK